MPLVFPINLKYKGYSSSSKLYSLATFLNEPTIDCALRWPSVYSPLTNSIGVFISAILLEISFTLNPSYTFASLYIKDGRSIYDLQKLLGHSTVVMTENYAHHSKDHLQNAVKGFQLVSWMNKIKY